MIENRINKIISLSNKEKYMILRQAIYNNQSYYVVSLLDENDNLTNNFKIFYEYQKDEDLKVQLVTDPNILNLIIKYLISNERK